MFRKRKELTTRGMIIVYILAFCLISAYESDRIVNSLQNSGLNDEVMNSVQRIVRDVRGEFSFPPLARAENVMVEFVRGLPEIGQVKPAVYAKQFPVDPLPAGNSKRSPEAENTWVEEKAEKTESAEEKAAADLPAPGASAKAVEEAKVEEAENLPVTEPAKLSETPAEAEKPPDSSPAEPEKPPEIAPAEPEKRLRPKRVLIIGDSFIAEGFGPALQRELKKYPGVEVIRKGQYSSGLVGGEDFNWASNLADLLTKHKPDLLVIHMGANDPLDLKDTNGKRINFGQDKWKGEYAARVNKLLSIAKAKKVLTFWVGLPIMGSKTYCAKIECINSIVSEECGRNAGCFYLDTWHALSGKEKGFMSHIKTAQGKQVRIRASDNVHLTEAGGVILTHYFLESISKHVKLDLGS